VRVTAIQPETTVYVRGFLIKRSLVALFDRGNAFATGAAPLLHLQRQLVHGENSSVAN
jgi:hypothetical protein